MSKQMNKQANKNNKTVARVPKTLVTARKKKGGSESQNVQQLVHAIALYLSAPGEPGVQPFRWASEFSQQDTALADPFSLSQPDFGETGGVYPIFSDNQGAAFLFRGVECAAIVYIQNSAGDPKDYKVQFRTQGVMTGSPEYTLPPYGELELLTPYAVTNSTTFSPHGTNLYAGAVSGSSQRFLWVDEGDQISVNHSLVTGTSADVTYVLDRYDATGLNKAVKNVAVTVTALPSVQILKAIGEPPGYYALRLESDSATATNLQINALTIYGTGSCMAHLSLPDFEKNWLRESGVRINCCSMMYSNTSPVMELGGTISGCQFGSKTDWMDLLKLDIVTAVQRVKGSQTMDIRRGMHGFLKPTQPEDFRIQAYSEIDDLGNFVDSFYPLDNRGSFLVFAMAAPGAGQGNEGYLTLRYGIEYLTQDTWASTGPADVPDEAFKEALGYLRNLDQFHENPSHFKEIWKKIKEGAKKVFNFMVTKGPGIIKGVQQVGEILGSL